MKKLSLLLLLLSSGLFFAQHSSLKVEVSNIKNSKGNIALALYDNAGSFTKKEIKATSVTAKKGKVMAIFDNVPAGTYAVALFHDENQNGKMDFNMVGIPKEAYAFSNNAKGILAPPKFKDAAFEINREEKIIKISL